MPSNEENKKPDLSHLSAKAKEDWQLIQSAIAGNQSAYETLLKKYKQSLFATILRIVKTKDVAEDIMLETFAKAFLKLNEYNPKFAFSTWLFRIGINKSIDYLRNKKNMPTSSIDDYMTEESETTFSEQLSSNENDPIQELLKEEKISFVKLIVDKLQPRYKRVVEMYYYEDLSCEEIAQQLGSTTNNVKAELFRARKVLLSIIISMKRDK